MSHTLCEAGRANRRSSLSGCLTTIGLSTRRAQLITATLCEDCGSAAAIFSRPPVISDVFVTMAAGQGVGCESNSGMESTRSPRLLYHQQLPKLLKR